MRSINPLLLLTCLATPLASGAAPPPSYPSQAEALAIHKKRVKDTAKKRRLSDAKVKAWNQRLIQGLQEGLLAPEYPWKFIVIHHTASEWSSLQRIDHFHRVKFEDPSGIEYHFLIANGKKQPRGLIELGRWPLQQEAIHLFKPEGAPDAIAISLVGNIHERKIYKEQYRALLALVSDLMVRYKIPIDRITTHSRVDGNLTVCPGKYFPFEKLVSDLKVNLNMRNQ